MNARTGTITSMWINKDGKSIGLAVVVHEGLHYSVHQVRVPYASKDNYKLGDNILIDTSSNTIIYQ